MQIVLISNHNMKCTQLSDLPQTHYDVVLCTVPWTDSDLPLMAPAALKPIIEKADLSCLAIDLNAEVFNYTASHVHKDKFVKFFFEEKISDVIEQELFDIFNSMADQILAVSPVYVGISLFSYVSQTAAKWLCFFLKKKNPNLQIIIGGPGCALTISGPLIFPEQLKSQGLIDYFIKGDAEHSLFELLTENYNYAGINSKAWKELTNEELSLLPMPDYSDYNFDLYTRAALPIIGSRGCVRKCTFCDYIQNWKKFQWRTAENIFEEMLYQSKKYKIYAFKFQDSLINGNLKEFNKLTKLISNYNATAGEQRFSWGSFYIFRDWTDRSAEEWKDVSASGATYLAVGIENFSEHIRYAMGKKFTNDSIIKHLEEAQKYQVKVCMMIIVGYINETQQDIEYTKQWLRDNVRFNDVVRFHWGTGLGIFDDTFLGNNKDTLGITMTGPMPHEWVSIHTPSTAKQRTQWAVELMQLSKELGYDVTNEEHDNHYLIEKEFIKK